MACRDTLWSVTTVQPYRSTRRKRRSSRRRDKCSTRLPKGSGSPALRNQPFCHFHDRYFNAPWEDTFPPLEDGNGVQAALMYVIERLRQEAFRGGQVNVPAVKQLLYGLQTASHNLRHCNFDPVLDRSASSDPAFSSGEEDRLPRLACPERVEGPSAAASDVDVDSDSPAQPTRPSRFASMPPVPYPDAAASTLPPKKEVTAATGD